MLKAVENYQKVMKGALRQIQVDEEAAEKALAKSLQAIANQCLKPLEKQAGGVSHWILGRWTYCDRNAITAV